MRNIWSHLSTAFQDDLYRAEQANPQFAQELSIDLAKYGLSLPPAPADASASAATADGAKATHRPHRHPRPHLHVPKGLRRHAPPRHWGHGHPLTARSSPSGPNVAATGFDVSLLPQEPYFSFDSDVHASVSTSALAVTALSALSTASAVNVSAETYNTATNTAIFGLDPSARIPDGNYAGVLKGSQVTDGSGNHLIGSDGTAGDDYQYNFFFYDGDLNSSRTIDFTDLLILNQHYNQQANYTQGDTNYDGTVNFTDLLALDQRYNTGLPLLGQATGLNAAARTSTSIDVAWTAPTDANVTSYDLYRDGQRVATGVTGTDYNDTGLGVDTNHVYTVVSRDDAGDTSYPTAELQAATATAPNVSISGPASVSNLDVYTLNLSATYPGDSKGNYVTGWSIDWGDGSAPQTIDWNAPTATHIFATASASPYTITATANDLYGSFPAQTTVQVTQNPVTFYVTGDPTYVVGQPITLTPTFSDPGGSTPSSWVIDWGDGRTDNISGNPSRFTHTYLAGDEDYTISVAVTVGTQTYNAQAAVGELAPTLTLSGGSSVTEGSTYTLNASATDGDFDTSYDWQIDWGDGTDVQDLTAAPGAFTHVYSDAGSYVITAIASDELAGDVQTLDVQVNEATPTLSISGTSSLVEPSQYTLADAFNDPGGLPVDSWTIDWGDGNTDASYQDPGQFTHAYADTGTYTITGTATTADDSYSVAQAVTVQEATPTLTIDPVGQITEGDTAQIHVHFNDPGGDTPTSWVVAWGDGLTDNFGSDPDRQGVFTHVYDEPSQDPNGYTIIVTATTVDGSYNANVQQPVVEATPMFYVDSIGTVAGGDTYTLQAFFTDSGKDDPTYHVNWGDGNTDTISDSDTFTHSYTLDPTGLQNHYDWTVVVTTDDHTDANDQSTPGYSYGGGVNVWGTGTASVNFSSPSTGTEGQPVTATATFSDSNQPPDQQGANEWFLDWGDGTGMSTWLGGQSYLANWQPQHTYAEAGNYTLTLGAGYIDSTTGSFNGFYTQSGSVTIEDATPTVNLTGDTATVTDLEYDCSAVFTDPGSNDIPDQWTLNWGDGSSTIYLGNVNAFSHVYKRSSVGGNGATFNVTATAHTDDGDFNGTTTVAVGKPVLDVKDADGNLLDEQHRHTTGAFLIVNNDDNGGQYDSSGNPIPDWQQTYGSTGYNDQNDPQLVKMMVEPLPTSVGGTYTLSWDSTYLQIWSDPNKQAAVTQSTPFDALNEHDVYLEAIPGGAGGVTPMMGADDVQLNWAATGGAKTKPAADHTKVTTLRIVGPQNVPSYSKYRYRLLGGIPAVPPVSWSVVGGTATRQGNTFGDILWNDPANPGSGWFGSLSFTAAGFKTNAWQANVVYVDIAPPAGGAAFAKGTPTNGGIDNASDKQYVLRTIASGADPTLAPGLKWSADVTLSGPSKGSVENIGVDRIEVGFVQNVTTYNVLGSYQSGKTLRSKLGDLLPGLDYDTTHQDGRPWYSATPAALSSTVAGAYTAVPGPQRIPRARGATAFNIASADTPQVGPRSSSSPGTRRSTGSSTLLPASTRQSIFSLTHAP